MDRRTYLAGVAGALVGLAGCSRPGDDGSSGDVVVSPGHSSTSTTAVDRTTAVEAPSAAPRLTHVESIEQVVDRRPRRRTVVTLGATGAVSVRDETGVAVVAPVDGVDGTTLRRSLPVQSVRAEGATCRMTVAGPVTDGTRIVVDAGTIAVGGRPVPYTEVDDVRGIDPVRGSLWFRPFVPTTPSLFPRDVYDHGTPPVDLTPATAPAAVRTELDRTLDAFVSAGFLTAERKRGVLGRFDDPAARRFCTDAETGSFRPRLLAATLATAGTVGEYAIDGILGGETPSGTSPRLIVADPETGYNATVFPALPGSGDPGTVVLHPVLLDEPLAVLGTLLAHECLHLTGDLPSTLVGRAEETIGAAVETVAYCQVLVALPDLARTRSSLVRFSNALALALCNSGRGGYPMPGLRQAPHPGDDGVFPDGSDDAESFVGHVGADYPVTPPVPSGGTTLLDRAVSGCLGRSVTGRGFTRATVDLLDRDLSVLSPAETLSVAAALDCELSRPDGTAAESG